MANTTWSTTDKSAVTLSGSNLIGTATGVGFARAADAQVTGKFYWECKPTVWGNANTGVGFCPGSLAAPSGATAVGLTAVFKSGNIWVDGVSTGSTLSARAANDVISIAVDFDAKLVWYRVAAAGNWNGSASANPATGVGGISVAAIAGGGFSGYPLATFGATSDAITANFGGSAFTGTVPSGFTSGFTSGAAPGNNQIVTQGAVEEWAVATPTMQLTQAAIEHWGPGVPEAWITQAGANVWTTLANPPAYVTQAGGIIWVDATSHPLDGVAITSAVGTIDRQFTGSVNLSGTSGTFAAGTFSEAISESLTGVAFSGSAGTLTTTTSLSVTLTGVAFSGSAGTLTANVTVPTTTADLTGVSANWQVGTFSLSVGSSKTLPGVSFSSAAGTLSNIIPTLGNLFGNTAQFSLDGAYIYDDLSNVTGGFSATSLASNLFNSFTMQGTVLVVTTAITGIALSGSTFVRGSPSGTTVGTISVSMINGSFSGSLSLSGPDAALFAISSNHLVTNGVLSGTSYNVNVVATQSGVIGSPFSQPFAITTTAQSITNVTLSNASFAGGSPSGTIVGTISVAMNVGSFSGTLSLSGTNASSFAISGTNLVTNGVLFGGTYSLNVIATQTGATGSPFTKAVTVTGTGLQQTITNITLANNTFISGSPDGTVVGAITVVMNTGPFTGTLTLSGTNATSFRIVGSNLVTNGVLAAGNYAFNVIATQTGALGSPFTRAMTVTGVRAMTNITLSNSSFVGGSASNTLVGAITVVMSSGTFGGTLALSGTNASSFAIVTNNLRTNGIVAAGSYAINITATQAGITGSPLLRSFSITATVPAIVINGITLTPATFVAGSPSGTLVGAISVATTNGPFSGTLSLSGPSAANFAISGTNLVTSGVLTTGTYNLNIVATQAGATGSPFTKAFAVTGTTSITNITLSNLTFAGGSPANTLVGTIAVTLSSGAFTGNLTLSGTNAASFHISGSNLLTTGVVQSGNYSLNIIATQAGAGGSPFTRAFSITGTGASGWLTTPPPQAAAAGFNNLAFYDDFLSASTITLTNSTAQRAFKWYPASWGGNLTSTNVQVNTTWTAGDANMTAQGVSGPGANASPSGGIVRLQGGASNAALISVDGWITSFPTSGTFQHGYAEAYIQYRPADISANAANVGWPGWWSWTMEAIQSLGFGGSTFSGSPTEVDFWEYGKTTNGNWGGMAFHWSMSGGIDALHTAGFTIDNNWHTIGMLWRPGVITFYYDNVLVGGSFTTSSILEANHLFVMLGSGVIITPQSATEPVPMFADWVRIWTTGTPTLPTLTVNLTATTGNTLYKTLFGSSMARDVNFADWQSTQVQTAAKNTAGFGMTGMFARGNCEEAAFTSGSPNLGDVDIVSAAIHNIITVPTSATSVNTNTGLFSYGLGGGTTDPTTYANAAKAIAQRFVSNGTPVFAYEVNNESDGRISDAQYCAIFNATADALHTVDPTYLVGGMNYSFMDSTAYHTFATTCGSRIGYISYHSYSVDPSFTDAAVMQQAITRFTNDATNLKAALAGTAAAGVPRAVGEYNMDGDGTGDPRQTGIIGAVFNLLGLWSAFNADPLTRFGHIWDWQGDSYYGLVINPANNPAGLPAYSVTPVGYALKGCRQYMGGSVVTSTLSSGNIKVLSTINGNQWAVLLINYDTGGAAPTTLNISLQNAPALGSSITRYEVSPANLSGLTTTITSSSLTNTSIPSTSIVILSGTF